jgi:2-polyprenyl-3-methyl-5-hydroxy-6-metoxy-1,4-benzoquinol methylase
VDKNNLSIKHYYEDSYKEGKKFLDDFFTINSDVSAFEECKVIFNYLDNWTNLNVLEIGCGEGALASLIASAGARVTAIDYSEEAIKIAKSKYTLDNLEFKTGKFEEINEKFDVVVLCGSLEHLDKPWKTLDNVQSKNLKDNGLIIASCPSFLNPRGYVFMALQLLFNVPMSLTDLHFLNPFDFEDYCKKSGLELEYRPIWQNWGAGERTIIDFRKRLKNALRDANMDNSNVEVFLDWMNKAVKYHSPEDWSGGATCYKMRKKEF